VVIAGPATFAPKSSRCFFTASPTFRESSTKRTSKPFRSSDDPALGGWGPFGEDMDMPLQWSRAPCRSSKLQYRSFEPATSWNGGLSESGIIDYASNLSPAVGRLCRQHLRKWIQCEYGMRIAARFMRCAQRGASQESLAEVLGVSQS